MKVSWLALSKLHEWEDNYRIGDVEAILASISKFGFNGVLRVWNGGTVIAGNHVLKALRQAKEIGLEPPHGVKVRGGEWHVATIDVSHLDEAGARAFAVADNRTAELAENDPDKLAALLESISADGLLLDVGYDDSDLAELLEAVKTGPEIPPVFEPEEEPGVKAPKQAVCPECGHTFSL